MLAAVLKGSNQLDVQNLPMPKVRDGEVLVRMDVCGICRTDMKAFTIGQRDLKLPRVLGHEITGRVAEIGRGVNGVRVNDRVQIAPGLSCGNCSYCQSGYDNMCRDVRIMGFDYDGGFAEYVLVPDYGVKNGVILKIPDHVSFYQAMFTEPLACSVNMQESLKVSFGDTVIIYGAGPLGILNARLAKARGASKVILVEKHEARMDSFIEKGFDECINSQKTDVVSAVMDITDGSGVNAVIPCCPGGGILSEGIRALARRGRFGLFSGLLERETGVDLNEIHYRELTLCGAYGCSVGHNRIAMDLISTGTIEVESLVSKVISLDDVIEGLRAVAELNEIKIAIKY